MSDNPEENEVEEGLKKLEQRRNHLLAALESRRRAQEQIPFIQRDIEQTEWQIKALEARPYESDEVPFNKIGDQLEEENKFLMKSYPVFDIPYGPSLFSSTASVITSGSIGVFEYVNRVKDLGTPDAIQYGETFIQAYDQIQESQQRPKEARNLLEKLHSPNILSRFDKAFNAYQALKSKSGEKTAAGNEMRNLIMGFRGELFKRAKRHNNENMTWATMSARLAINGGRGKEHIFLSNQQRVYSSLNQRLSDVLKDREGGSITNLDSIWMEILDFIFTVMGLVAI